MAWEGIYRGEVKTYQLKVTNNGSPVNLTGAVLYLAVRPIDPPPAASIVSDADALIAKSSATAAEIMIIDAVGGLAEAYFVKTDTFMMTPGNYMVGVEAVLAGATDPVVLVVDYLPVLPDYVRAV